MTTISLITAVRNGAATIGDALTILGEQSVPCEHGVSTDAKVAFVRCTHTFPVNYYAMPTSILVGSKVSLALLEALHCRSHRENSSESGIFMGELLRTLRINFFYRDLLRDSL